MSANSSPPQSNDPSTLVDHFFRHQYAQLVATLTRRLGVRHWDLAEDVVQSALQRALTVWSRQGVPQQPAAWLHRVAWNLAVDSLRRQQRHAPAQSSATPAPPQLDQIATDVQRPTDESLNDDLLQMIFFCCDPSVPAESRIALALKTLCGFGNREIAAALLSTETSVARRITRAKHSLREHAQPPGQLTSEQLLSRLPAVQSIVYLLFNEGYCSALPDKSIREDLCEEAVRLALLLAEHPLTAGGTSSAMLALLLFHAARLDARIDAQGALLMLREQDRTLWDHGLIAEAFRWFRLATSNRQVSRYHAEAWIAAEHCRAASIEQTNWDVIVQAYDLLCRLTSSPIHALNRAIALGHRDGATAGLEACQQINGNKQMESYYLWHATLADLQRQLGKAKMARAAYQRAWQLAPSAAEEELISRKIDMLDADPNSRST